MSAHVEPVSSDQCLFAPGAETQDSVCGELEKALKNRTDKNLSLTNLLTKLAEKLANTRRKKLKHAESKIIRAVKFIKYTSTTSSTFSISVGKVELQSQILPRKSWLLFTLKLQIEKSRTEPKISSCTFRIRLFGIGKIHMEYWKYILDCNVGQVEVHPEILSCSYFPYLITYQPPPN